MKKHRLLILSALVCVAVLFNACTPEDFALDEIILNSELAYNITQNAEDPNMVIMESLTPGATPMWSTPVGRSIRVKDTVRLAFPGLYKFVYGVQSGGGFVQADTIEIDITTSNLSYVDDPLWNLLTGGPGQEKTWLLDLDENSISKNFLGPLYFSGTEDSWTTFEMLQNGLTYDDIIAELGVSDVWNWFPDYAGNTWLMDATDFGSMTFSLKGGAFLEVDHNSLGRQESGTFLLDAEAKTLKTSDAFILHDVVRDGQVVDWGNLKVITLTEDFMQLAALRDEGLSGEGPALFIYNFISKDYSDNWTPPADEGDPNIDLGVGDVVAADLVSLSTTKSWSLSPDTPFDWADLDGNLLNGWQSASDYPDWAGFSSADQAAVSRNKILFSSDGTVKTINSDGVESEGTYEVDATTNDFTFSDIVPSFNIGAWVVATTTSQNQWRIVKAELTGAEVTDIWFGQRDETGKNEYMVFHFVLGSAAVDPVEAARRLMIEALTGSAGSRTFKVSDSWPVDWLDGNQQGGWTSETTFADDFTSNSWVWTEAVKAGLQDPTLTFSYDAGLVTATKVQDGVTTAATVTLDPEANTIEVDMDLIVFTDAASGLPTYGPIWYISKVLLTDIETDGLWLGKLGVDGSGDPETTAIHYVVSGE